MTVSEQIIQVVNVLCEKFGIAVDWTGENVIPYVTTLCEKLISYEIATSIAWIVFWLALSIGSIIATKKFYPVFKNGVENEGSYECGWTAATIFAIFGLVILFSVTIIVMGVQIFDIIKCTTFSELYIFEYINALVNGV